MSLVAKWIFNNEFNKIQKQLGKDSDYIGQDWAQGGANYKKSYYNNGAELLKNFDPKGFAQKEIFNDWQRGKVNRVFGVNNTGADQQPAIWNDKNKAKINSALLIKLSFYYKYSSNLSKVNRIGVQKINNLNSLVSIEYYTDLIADNKWHYYEKYISVADIPNGYVQILFRATFSNEIFGEYFIDEILIQELTVGMHIFFNNNFDYSNQIIQNQSSIFKGGDALNFDNVNDYGYILFSQAAQFQFLPSQSFSILFRGAPDNPNYDTVISTGERGIDGYEIYWKQAGELAFQFQDNAAISWTGLDNTNEHTYILKVTSNGTKWATAELLVDGVSKGSQDISALNDVSYSQDLRIGAGYVFGAIGDFYGGTIENINVYDNALSEQEVQEETGLATGWKVAQFASGVKFKNNDFKQYLYFPENVETEVYREIHLSRTGDFTFEYLATDGDNTVNGINFEIYEKNSGNKILNSSITIGTKTKVSFSSSEKDIILKITAQQDDNESFVELDYLKIY